MPTPSSLPCANKASSSWALDTKSARCKTPTCACIWWKNTPRSTSPVRPCWISPCRSSKSRPRKKPRWFWMWMDVLRRVSWICYEIVGHLIGLKQVDHWCHSQLLCDIMLWCYSHMSFTDVTCASCICSHAFPLTPLLFYLSLTHIHQTNWLPTVAWTVCSWPVVPSVSSVTMSIRRD